jgi:hypothetical protein
MTRYRRHTGPPVEQTQRQPRETNENGGRDVNPGMALRASPLGRWPKSTPSAAKSEVAQSETHGDVIALARSGLVGPGARHGWPREGGTAKKGGYLGEGASRHQVRQAGELRGDVLRHRAGREAE